MNHRPAAGNVSRRTESRRPSVPRGARSTGSRLAITTLVIAVLLVPGVAVASLVDLTATARPGSYDDLERAAAAANQAAYDALLPGCGGGVVGPSCNPAQLGVFEETRELVHTANEILANGGPTQFSLSVDDEGLGNALRWTAAEEVAAQSRAATDFANGQVSNVQNRITALRFGARGFSIAGLDGLPTRDVPALAGAHALGSAGESTPHGLSRLGGFVNGSFGWGQHDATTFEDAFDYESWDITAGIDYRIRDDLVLGLTGGYAANEIDFDASKSIVAGGIETESRSHPTCRSWSRNSLYAAGFGLTVIDPIVALGAAAMLVAGALRIGLGAWDALMDRSASPEVIAGIEAIARDWPGIEGFHDLKTRTSGNRIFVNMHVEIDGDLSLREAHSIGADLRRAILAAYPTADVILHKDPEGDPGEVTEANPR